MFRRLAAAVAYFVCSSVVAGSDLAGELTVEVLTPGRLADARSGNDTCCNGDSSKIYQAVPYESLKFSVHAKVAPGTESSSDNYMSVVIDPTNETECLNYGECEQNSCLYNCTPKNAISINGSACFKVVATSRRPTIVRSLFICVYNQSAKPLEILNRPTVHFDKESTSLEYIIGGYPLPPNITVRCNEQNEKRGTVRLGNASISFIQGNEGHYTMQLDNVTNGEIRCYASAFNEFHSVTSGPHVVNVTLAHMKEPVVHQTPTAVMAVAHVSVNASSDPVAHGAFQSLGEWLPAIAIAFAALIAIIAGMTVWRRSTIRRKVTINNENHHTTIVNNDNRQTIVTNYQCNYIDSMSHPGVCDGSTALLACSEDFTASVIDSEMFQPVVCHLTQADIGSSQCDHFERVS